MNKIHKLILITAIILFSSCNDFLEIVPKDKFIPTTCDDYENMLNDVVCNSYSDYFLDLITDDVFLPEGMPDGLFAKQQLPARKIYTFNPEAYTESDLDPLWSQAYSRLFYYNTVIDEILKTEADDLRKQSIRAEALLFRAGEFLTLVNAYAKHYDAATAEKDPGIPLVCAADINIKHSRNSVKEVYQQIIQDLEEAVPYLPKKTSAPTKFRACKAGAYALLSRTYLYMGDYKLALQNAEKSLAEYSTLANMNQYKVIAPGPFEYGPAMPLGWTDIPDGQFHPETIVSKHFLRPFGLGMDACASKDLAKLFDNNDRRWVLYYANNWPPAPPFNYWAKYQTKIYLRGDYYNNFLSTPEQYLIRAECNARDGKLKEALDDINLLRKNRIAPAVYKDYLLSDLSNSKEKVLDVVLAERRRELAFMSLRHIDLKRFSKEGMYTKNIVHIAEGKEYVLIPGSNKYIRQIWPSASKFNPDWALNPVND